MRRDRDEDNGRERIEGRREGGMQLVGLVGLQLVGL